MFKNIRLILQNRYGLARLTTNKSFIGYEEEFKPKDDYVFRESDKEYDAEYGEEFKPKEDYNVDKYVEEKK